jgi:hypothetical protein
LERRRSRAAALLFPGGAGHQGLGRGVHGAALPGGRVQHQGGMQAGEGVGRCRNARRKARCRGTAAAVQRRAEEEDPWGSRAELERSALRTDGRAAAGENRSREDTA